VGEENTVCPKCMGAGFVGPNWKDHRDVIRLAIEEGVTKRMVDEKREFLKAQDSLIQERVETLTTKRIEALERFENNAYRQLLAQFSSLRDIETALIREALKLEGGNVTRTARRLGIGRATMYRKMEQLRRKKA